MYIFEMILFLYFLPHFGPTLQHGRLVIIFLINLFFAIQFIFLSLIQTAYFCKTNAIVCGLQLFVILDKLKPFKVGLIQPAFQPRRNVQLKWVQKSIYIYIKRYMMYPPYHKKCGIEIADFIGVCTPFKNNTHWSFFVIRHNIII